MFKLLTSALLALTIVSCGSVDRYENQAPKNEGEITQLSLHKTFEVNFEWIDGPSVENPNSLVFHILTPYESNLESIENVSFLPFMTVHGHPGAIKKMTVTQDPEMKNMFVVENFYFTMAGEWDMIFTATVNGKEDKATYTLEVE